MSVLHEELAGGTHTPCKVCAFLATLSPEQRALWEKELALPVRVIGNTSVASALGVRGVRVTESAVRRHRTKHVAG